MLLGGDLVFDPGDGNLEKMGGVIDCNSRGHVVVRGNQDLLNKPLD